MTQDDSLVGRGRGAVGRIAGAVGSAQRQVTGQALGQTVAEFSETYTQVLLGMHQDLEAAVRRVRNAEGELGELRDSTESRLTGIASELASLRVSIDQQLTAVRSDAAASAAAAERSFPSPARPALALAAIALVLSATAIGVALWSAI